MPVRAHPVHPFAPERHWHPVITLDQFGQFLRNQPADFGSGGFAFIKHLELRGELFQLQSNPINQRNRRGGQGEALGGQPFFGFEGEKGDKQTFSYWRLWQEVNKFANVLRSMGVKKGDRVTIYMGRIPELVIAMLATVKIGAVHSVVYGGFSENALADRIEDAQSRVLITCDGAWLRGNIVELKKISNDRYPRSKPS